MLTQIREHLEETVYKDEHSLVDLRFILMKAAIFLTGEYIAYMKGNKDMVKANALLVAFNNIKRNYVMLEYPNGDPELCFNNIRERSLADINSLSNPPEQEARIVSLPEMQPQFFGMAR
jgi:hypothetical protein